ncbi:MAG: transcription elongation factor Spt5 [Candidatus Nanoarchaeia archaeon]
METENTDSKIFALRTTANREDQVMDFVGSNVKKKGINVYSIVRAHGMRGYVFVEAENLQEAEQAAYNVPYARGILKDGDSPKYVSINEIENMLEQVKKDVDVRPNDIAEIISGPFKLEKAKIKRVDKTKEEVIVELLEAAVPIPITLSMDSIKVIRREEEESE